MELTLYLRKDRPDPSGRLPIHARICWQSQKVRFATGDWVDPGDWNETDERLKKTAPGSRIVNRRLASLTDGLDDFFASRLVLPTAEEVKAEVARLKTEKLGHAPKTPAPEILVPTVPTIGQFAARYLSDMRASRSKDWQVSVGVVTRHLQAFRPGIDWPDLTINQLNQFKAYLQEELDLSDNTIHAYIGLFRKFCEYAERNHIVVPPDRAWLEAGPGKVIRPALEESEVITVRDTSLYDQSGLFASPLEMRELIRWYFVMACRTGLRHVDLWQLQAPKIVTVEGVKCISVLQQKTGNFVSIPLDDDTLHWLNHPPRIRKTPVPETYNPNLKLIGQAARLDRTVTLASFYQGELVSDTMPLHLSMSSHIARRTFASQMTAAGMPTRTLQLILGHESIASTEKYATVSSGTIVQQVIAARQIARNL